MRADDSGNNFHRHHSRRGPTTDLGRVNAIAYGKKDQASGADTAALYCAVTLDQKVYVRNHAGAWSSSTPPLPGEHYQPCVDPDDWRVAYAVS